MLRRPGRRDDLDRAAREPEVEDPQACSSPDAPPGPGRDAGPGTAAASAPPRTPARHTCRRPNGQDAEEHGHRQHRRPGVQLDHGRPGEQVDGVDGEHDVEVRVEVVGDVRLRQPSPTGRRRTRTWSPCPRSAHSGAASGWPPARPPRAARRRAPRRRPRRNRRGPGRGCGRGHAPSLVVAARRAVLRARTELRGGWARGGSVSTRRRSPLRSRPAPGQQPRRPDREHHPAHPCEELPHDEPPSSTTMVTPRSRGAHRRRREHGRLGVDRLDLPAYLDRMGVAQAAGREALDELYLAHVRGFTFDNIDVLLGTTPRRRPSRGAAASSWAAGAAATASSTRRCSRRCCTGSASRSSAARPGGRLTDRAAHVRHCGLVDSTASGCWRIPGLFGMSVSVRSHWSDGARRTRPVGVTVGCGGTPRAGRPGRCSGTKDDAWELMHTPTRRPVRPGDVALGHH